VRSSAGALEYESIYFKEPTAEDYTQPIFLNVLPYRNQIVFHAHNQLFFYNSINKSYRTVQAPDFFNKLYVIDDSLYASSYSGKVYLFENDDFKLIASTGNDAGSVVYFGSSNYLDYTIGATEQQRKSYRARHDKEKNQKFDTPGALSYWILWGDSTDINKNIADYKKRYNLKSL